ncbi:polysaccharide biosynthesis/export family protein [Ancylobacter sp. 6x-1]|uniref:Polysaccharide biosynthesis/export family protein n=1 Tax=Ancylobacter crimeensis TaxID=2579147 RepID=A0ABT0DBJ8_9HYPH|nr:polysaccharide biosynthesis/export family protein [Ancylobacter crimeensis]MCK0197274.1 polysaccharide biosynthesis/export family protein [Ancylobacter crimeensis]
MDHQRHTPGQSNPPAAGRFPLLHAVKRTTALAIAVAAIALWTSTASASDVAAASTASTASTASNEYRLGPEDKIRLKVLEWRATQDEIFEWQSMTGEFAVNPEGHLELPLIGTVQASGRTSADIGREVGESLQHLMGLAEVPRVAIEISSFRPFYATGEVAKPGPYPYRPKLTVLQAVAIAGGIQRPADAGMMRLGRDVISGRGEITVLGQELDALRAKLARLQSELDNAADIAFSPELMKRTDERAITLLMQQERQIFVGRRDAFKSQNDALVNLKSFLDKEVVTLQGQLDAQDKQMALVNQELQTISGLVEKGYAVSSRQLGLERTVAQIQGDKLRLETELLRVRQDSSRADISMNDLKNTRTNELTADLRATQAKIDDTRQKMKTAQQLLYEASVVAPHRYQQRNRGLQTEASYVIVRNTGTEITEIDATETTLVQPGDTLKVTLPLPDDPDDPTLDSGSAPLQTLGAQP